MRTQVGIIGAGPAGLLLSHLLHLQGIDSVVLETRSRDYVEKRVRAGVLEQNTVDLLREVGLSERLDREGLTHHGIELRFDGTGHRIPMSDLAGGRSIMIYGQQEVVKDMIEVRLRTGARIHFEVDDVQLDGVESDTPTIRYRRDGQVHELRCDVIAGCDGFHGVSRRTIPGSELTTYEREYPFGWLGVLAAAPPSTDEIIYCSHERGFAMHSLRSPERSRLYLQVDPDDDIANWPNERIWGELHTRLATHDGWKLNEGSILEKGITPMRSFVIEPMQYRRLFLAGDAAHIVPPTGAKGLNLALADVKLLAAALTEWYHSGRTDLMESYSDNCLRRVWRVQDFAEWMTSMLHVFGGEEAGCQRRLQLARLRYVTGSTAAATSLAENYTGLKEV